MWDAFADSSNTTANAQASSSSAWDAFASGTDTNTTDNQANGGNWDAFGASTTVPQAAPSTDAGMTLKIPNFSPYSISKLIYSSRG